MGFYPCSHSVRVTLLPAFPPETDEYPPELNLDVQPEPLVRLAEALLCFFLHRPGEVWKRQCRSLLVMYTQTAGWRLVSAIHRINLHYDDSDSPSNDRLRKCSVLANN